MSVFNFDNIKESRQRDYYREILTSNKYAKEVRAYSNADHFISLFDEKLKSLKGQILKLHSKAGLKNLLGNIFTYFSVMFFAVFFTYKTVQGEMLPGTLVLYIGLMISMQEQVRRTLVNNIAEDMVFKSFRRLCDGHGGIMISHHLSGVMSVDYIMVLEGGRLIESGSHEELLKLNGHYAMLYNIQAEKFKKGMAEDGK